MDDYFIFNLIQLVDLNKENFFLHLEECVETPII